MTRPKVVVLGAGIAGLVTAYELAVRGVDVEVLEAAPFPGGRTSTYVDARGRTVDTGLHVVADHYVNLLDVLGSVGASKHLYWVDKHTYLQAGRPPLEWYFSQREAPFHLARPFREMPVPLKTRMHLAKAGLVMAAYDQADLSELDELTYMEWHDKNRLGDGFVLDLAEAAADAATFLTVREAAARPVLSWIKYLMRHRRAGDVGLFKGTLEACLVGPLVRAIEAAGGRVRCGIAVTELETDGQRLTGVRVARSSLRGPGTAADGVVPFAEDTTETLAADYVVSALTIQGLRKILSPALVRAAGLSQAMTLTTTPAMSLIVWFDRLVRPMPKGAPLVTGCAMRDFVDFDELGRRGGAPGSVHQFVITRASARWHDTDEEVVRDVLADLESVWPGARGARVVDYALERIGAAMFAAVPGAHAKRPFAQTPIANFVLAGDWTRHDANASMEGAALSGRLAADRIAEKLGVRRVAVREAPDPTVVPALRRIRRPLGQLFGAV